MNPTVNMNSASTASNSTSEMKGTVRKGVPIESKSGEKKQRTGANKSKRIKRSKAEAKKSTATPSGYQPDAKSSNLRKKHESSNTKEAKNKGKTPVRNHLRKELDSKLEAAQENVASEDKDLTEEEEEEKTSLPPPQYLVDANLLMRDLDLDFLRWLHNGGRLFNDKMIPVTYVLEELRENELVFFKLTVKVFYAATGRSKANFRPSHGSMAMGFEVQQEGKVLIMKALNDCKAIVEAEHFEQENESVEYKVISPFKPDEKTGEESSAIFYNHTDGKGVPAWSDITCTSRARKTGSRSRRSSPPRRRRRLS